MDLRVLRFNGMDRSAKNIERRSDAIHTMVSIALYQDMFYTWILHGVGVLQYLCFSASQHIFKIDAIGMGFVGGQNAL